MQTVLATRVSRQASTFLNFSIPLGLKKKKWGDLPCFLKLFVQMIVFVMRRMTNRCKSHLAFKECQGRVHLSTKLPTLRRQLSTPAWVFYWRQPYYKILLVQWTLSSTTLLTPSVLPLQGSPCDYITPGCPYLHAGIDYSGRLWVSCVCSLVSSLFTQTLCCRLCIFPTKGAVGVLSFFVHNEVIYFRQEKQVVTEIGWG